MSFGLGHGRTLDDAPGVIGIGGDELPPLPDEALTNPRAGWLDPRAWFQSPERPFEIEIGSGKGAFLLQQGEAQPSTNILGIEWAGEFYAYTADRVRRRGLTNVRVLNADATEFLRWRVPSGIVRTVHLYFSDPWPKKRHHKKRVVRDEVLAQLHRVLEPGGEVRIVTDHDDYWVWMEAHFDRWCGHGPVEHFAGSLPAFERLDFTRPESAGEGEVVGTNFERKYAREGRPFHATVLKRVP